MAGWTLEELRQLQELLRDKSIDELREALRDIDGVTRRWLGEIRSRLESRLPRLDPDQYRLTSPATPRYNCIAWAMGITDAWWWPSPLGFGFWPENLQRSVSVDAFQQMFLAQGFTECSDGKLESGVEKIALYVRSGSPTHAARQLPNGRWTSKLGRSEDIEHRLEDLESPDEYGEVELFFKRGIPVDSNDAESDSS